MDNQWWYVNNLQTDGLIKINSATRLADNIKNQRTKNVTVEMYENLEVKFLT